MCGHAESSPTCIFNFEAKNTTVRDQQPTVIIEYPFHLYEKKENPSRENVYELRDSRSIEIFSLPISSHLLVEQSRVHINNRFPIK